jgi:hypothetical protein
MSELLRIITALGLTGPITRVLGLKSTLIPRPLASCRSTSAPVPGSGIPYPSVIVKVTPDEFERIKVQELKLPDGWTIDEEYPK